MNEEGRLILEEEGKYVRLLVYEHNTSTDQDCRSYVPTSSDYEYEVLLTYKRHPPGFDTSAPLCPLTKNNIWSDLIPIIDWLRSKLARDCNRARCPQISFLTCWQSAHLMNPMQLYLHNDDSFWAGVHHFVTAKLLRNDPTTTSFSPRSFYMSIL